MTVIPFDDRDGFIWFDGKLVPWRDAKIHVLTHGLHYASSVFEGERVYSGRIYKLAEHTARLFESARILDMEIPFTEKEIFDACYEGRARAGHRERLCAPRRVPRQRDDVGGRPEHENARRDRGVAMAVLFRSEGKAERHPPRRSRTGSVPRPTPRPPRRRRPAST
jgi:branched-subunit amino acid aminotransferase/4-amino-4-deoxychorismate lyase